MPRVYITTPPEVRFWRHVDKDGPIPPLHPDMDNCWLWVGSLDPQGYGHFWDGIRLTYSHRFAFGDVPPGMEINHLCEVENCCRRSHLEAVPHMTNMRYSGPAARKAAQTHCIRGHLFDELNTFISKNGTRHCKACSNARALERYRAHRISI